MNRGLIGTLTLSAAFALPAGCGGSQAPIGAPGSAQQSLATGRGKSWMLPEANKSDLLYVSSSDGNVYTYTYPKGRLVATLSGFTKPLGECVDAAGDVFITAYSSPSSTRSSIYEYAHGGSSPITTLGDPGHAFGCSVDPTTGNLAVANPYDTSNPYNIAYGSVAIYQGASGSPTMYYPSRFGIVMCGYDNKGSLYLTVYGSQPGVAQLARLAKGSSAFKLLSINATIYGNGYFPPGVQWDGKQMTVSSNKDDGNPVFLYQLSISRNKATVVGTTTLQSEKNHHEGQLWIDGSSVVGIFSNKGKGGVASWDYPEGGNPTLQINHIVNRAQYSLFGITVSDGAPR
ncbi:MAG TPA: hypothetical protein VHR97_00205 [Candidatus Baltobacteraceae bacterium]|jgi:hypothetical protein|nr:hypothetical protein [Candidatus Baltobacteraceae bacterium]